MKIVVPGGHTIFERFQDRLRNLAVSQEHGTGAAVIEQTVHREEGFSRGQATSRKGAMGRETVP